MSRPGREKKRRRRVLVVTTCSLRPMRASAGNSCTAALNAACCVLPKAGGGPPDCSNIRATAPPSLRAATHRTMVWGSRPNTSAVTEAGHPRASSYRACQRSRSRGTGASISRRCRFLAFISYCPRNRSIYLTPIPSLHGKLFQLLQKSTLSPCAYHLGLGFRWSRPASGSATA